MFDFFDTVIEYISLAWEFLSNLVTSLITALTLTVTSVGTVSVLAGFMPSIIGSCIVVFFAIAVTKFIVGR